jgi:pseudouridine-5'-phosphate glycosidase
MPNYLRISPEVVHALAKGIPVVALESTIISHGMPYPENVTTAHLCEQTVRENGAVPATIAILNGEIVVGLSITEIEQIGRRGEAAIKTSRRDIPFVLASHQDGAMTVSGTMIAASLAGIRFFATGGIGGVHRNAESTMDISADLDELAKTSVCVVCAGAKSILDLPKTLEYLETKGVPVIGYQTDYLPAFFTKSSSCHLDHRLDTPQAIAAMAKLKWELGLLGGILIANPIPDAFSFDAVQIERAIEVAVDEMNHQGIHGKETTPFLLKRIAQITGGESLKSNIALVTNNCRLAAKIAVAYQELEVSR